MEKIVNFIKEHKELCTIAGLAAIFYFIFFHNIGTYPLMDIDETRYVTMAKDMLNRGDYLTLYLNGEYFFEKPPLYFWMECLSFALFGKVTELTARIPVASCGLVCAFLTYFIGRKIVSRKFGIISSLILATSLEFIMLAKFAILDIVLTMFILISVYSGIMTYYCTEKNKKYCWWIFYLASGLAVMSKGIPGFVIPFGTIFFVTLINKNFKDFFKPLYMLPGIILFLAVTLPWHIIMFNIHNPLFYNEYIVKHHLHRFIDSQDLGRKEPFYFFILVFLWGFIPWIFSALSVFITKIKERTLKTFLDNKFLVANVVMFAFIMLFFSSSSTKLVTYLIAIYMPAAFLMAHVWQQYIDSEKYKKPIDITVYILGGICMFASVVALFTPLFLPTDIENAITPFKWFAISLLFGFGLLSIISAKQNKRLLTFASYVMFMVLLSAWGTSGAFKTDYKFGQDDLIKYAKYAKENNKQIMTLGFRQKYSLIYYANQHVIFSNDLDYELFKKHLKNPDFVIILRNKKIPEISENVTPDNYTVIDKGVKYTLVKGN